MRLVHATPARLKQIDSGTSMDKIDTKEMIVSVHKVRMVDPKSRMIVLDLEAAKLDTDDRDSIFAWSLPRNMASVASYRNALLSWVSSDTVDVQVDFPAGIDSSMKDMCEHLVKKMVECGAGEDGESSGAYIVASSSVHEQCMKVMSSVGLVQPVVDGAGNQSTSSWRLSKDSLRRVRHVERLTPGRQIMVHRPTAAMSTWTLFELIEFMDSVGWQRQALDQPGSLGELVPFEPGAERVWYIAGKRAYQVFRAYLLALVLTEAKTIPGPVPHFQKAGVYVDLINWNSKKRPRLTGVDDHAAVEDQDLLALEDGCMQEDGGSSESDAIIEESDGSAAAVASSSSSSSGSKSSSGSDSSSDDGDGDAEVIPPPVALPGRIFAGRVRHEDSFAWGAGFFFTYKITGRSWQALCKYHNFQGKLRCTKTLSVPKSSAHEEMSETIIRRLKYWCVHASLHDTKESHAGPRGVQFEDSEIPDDEELEQRALDLPVPE
jgi:hypothetical protein